MTLLLDRATPIPVRRRWWPPALGALLVAQTVVAYRPGSNTTPFIDEGLYVYIGHRMIDHLLHGAFLLEYPGSYLSGAPGFYPVLAALGDSVGGLAGARAVSLLGVLAATVCVGGLGRALYGPVAGLLGALAFALSGSVIFQSHLAVYDSTMMALVAGAAWLAVVSARGDQLNWAPVIGGLLALAFLAKYAGAVYAPVVAALAAAVGWPRLRWLAVRQAAFVLATAVVTALFVLVLWGQSLWQGIRITTSDRIVLYPDTPRNLTAQVLTWVGPWLLLGLLGAALRWRDRWVVLVLLAGSVIGVAQQIRIGDATSLNKHVGFGLVFAAPLIGALAAAMVRRWALVPVVAVVFGLLGTLGLQQSREFLTSWVQDDTLLPPLRAAIAANPDKAVLAEEGAPERYALRDVLAPGQYGDTYALSYGGLSGDRAYRAAVDQTHYGVIYLSLSTARGRWLHDYLDTGRTPYQLVAMPPRVLRGHQVGNWFVYTPRARVSR